VLGLAQALLQFARMSRSSCLYVIIEDFVPYRGVQGNCARRVVMVMRSQRAAARVTISGVLLGFRACGSVSVDSLGVPDSARVVIP